MNTTTIIIKIFFEIKQSLTIHFGLLRVLGAEIEVRGEKKINKEKKMVYYSQTRHPPSTRITHGSRPQQVVLDNIKKGVSRL